MNALAVHANMAVAVHANMAALVRILSINTIAYVIMGLLERTVTVTLAHALAIHANMTALVVI
jgi:hypothetical protein